MLQLVQHIGAPVHQASAAGASKRQVQEEAADVNCAASKVQLIWIKAVELTDAPVDQRSEAAVSQTMATAEGCSSSSNK